MAIKDMCLSVEPIGPREPVSMNTELFPGRPYCLYRNKYGRVYFGISSPPESKETTNILLPEEAEVIYRIGGSTIGDNLADGLPVHYLNNGFVDATFISMGFRVTISGTNLNDSE